MYLLEPLRPDNDEKFLWIESVEVSVKMKLLESGRLEALSSALAILNGDSAVQGRVESYSCKMAGGEKAFYKRFTADGETSRDLQALSPPEGVANR